MALTTRRRRLEVKGLDDVTVVGFASRKMLDERNVRAIGAHLFRLVGRSGRRKLLLNFDNVEYMSSAVLAKLITLYRKLLERDGRLVLCGIDALIMEVFELTKLDKLFTICASQEEALAALREDGLWADRARVVEEVAAEILAATDGVSQRNRTGAKRPPWTAQEGAVREITMEIVGRSRKFRNDAVRVRGWRCEVCGFDFGEVYGELGEGYIEIHHLRALSQHKGEAKATTFKRVRAVCANCHRVLHRRGARPISVEMLRRIVEERRLAKATQ
jgi:anti-sigma B factor antagonist